MRAASAAGFLVMSASLLACSGAGRGPVFPTSARFDEARRTPPSFAVDAPETSPDVASVGAVRSAEMLGLYSAVTPLDPEAARDVVSRFFMAVVVESNRELLPLFAAQAWVVSEGSRQPAQSVWRARFAQLDYTTLAGRVVATPSTLHTYTSASIERARRDGVPAPQAPDEVVVVARPALSWVGKARLFGEELAFRLRPKRDRPDYEIAEIVEDFRLP